MLPETDLAGQNIVAIEVAGYNVNSFEHLDQPSFLQAEIVDGDTILAATGTPGSFMAAILPQRVQKVARYSFQRAFSEYYQLTPECDRWRVGEKLAPVRCTEAPAKALLPRRVSYPKFEQCQPTQTIGGGRLEHGAAPQEPWRIRFLDKIGPTLAGFTLSEQEICLPHIMERYTSQAEAHVPAAYLPEVPFSLKALSYRTLDLNTNLTGFLGLQVHCAESTQLVLAFDELLTDGDVSWKRPRCVNLVGYELAPGRYSLETFEPYTLRYLKVMVLEGAAEFQGVYLRTFGNPDVWGAHFATSDSRFNQIFAAGRETFSANAPDIFMDCPSRERAGWLCDSYFTARAERVLTGSNVVRLILSRTLQWRTVFLIFRPACCRCVIRPIITTRISFPIGHSGWSWNWKNTKHSVVLRGSSSN